jgi:hypothetical protein
MVLHLGAISICDVLIFSLKKDTKLFSEQRPTILFEFFAENIICFVFEYGHGAQSRICATSSTDHSIRLHIGSKMRTILFKYAQLRTYDVHRSYHARNVGTFCASLTMRREIVATRRAGLTTSVIKRIPSKGNQCS